MGVEGMMVTRLTVTLEQSEYSALLRVSESELRDPRDQIRFVLRQELERRGLLQAAERCMESQTGEGADDEH